MFSFLTGKKDDKDVKGVQDVKEATDVKASPSATSTLPPPSAVDTDAPPRSWDIGDESPFTPPAAWNVDALTAPAPKPDGEVPQVGPLDAAATAEMQQPIIELLIWMRVPGDVIFSIGAVLFTWFVVRLWVLPKRDTTFAPGVRPVGE